MTMLRATSLPTAAAYLHWFESLHTPKQQRVTALLIPTAECMVQMPGILRAAAKIRNLQCITLSIRDKSIAEIKEILENSFLGSYFLYCIGDIEQFPKNLFTLLTSYLMHYQGPHYIVVLCSSDAVLPAAWQQNSVSFPSTMNLSQFAHFCTYW